VIRAAALAGPLLALAFSPAVPAVEAAAPVACARVVAVGDLHGAHDAFVSILLETGLVDAETDWSGGDACLVQLGDVIDRGAGSRRILDLLMALERQAPGRVVPLLGNHEVMNLIGDLRSVDPAEFGAFAGEEDPADRSAGLREFRRGLPADRDEATLLHEFNWRFPPGWFAHRRAFSPDGVYGSWLARHATLIVIDGTLFVHGGIGLADAREGIEALNARVGRDLAAFHDARDRLIAAGWVERLDPLGAGLTRVRERHSRARPTNDTSRAARTYLAAVDGILMRPDGPLWNRDLALAEQADLGETVETIVAALGVERIVVGHTPTADHSIHARFDGRVFVIDSGAAATYGGRISALEIGRDGTVRAIYLGESRVLSGPTRAPSAPGSATAAPPAEAAPRRNSR